MKKIVCVLSIFVLFFTSLGCYYFPYKECNDAYVSDGKIKAMNISELIVKLSKLNRRSMMKDVVNVFGKYPKIDIQTDNCRWFYYSGDIIISIYGVNLTNGHLYSVCLSSNSEYISIDLPK